MSRKKTERKEQMLQVLEQEDMMHIAELAACLEVSEMTARRYVAELDPAVRLVGAHVLLQKARSGRRSDTYLMAVEKDRNIDMKRAVGRAAARLVEENDVIFIDCGTTTPFIAQHIDEHIAFKAICCSLNIFNILHSLKGCQIMLTGGAYHESTQVFSSSHALEMIRDIRITKAFISAAGVNQKLGLTCFNQYETDLKREVMKFSQQVYLVADSSKFSDVKIAYFGDVVQVDTIVTDNGLAVDDESWIRSMGVDLIKV